MRITERNQLLSIHFENPDATWGVLVIDDKWDVVKQMVCDQYDVVTSTKTTGLREHCTSKERVLAYWDALPIPEETFERALLLLPWMVASTEEYGSITFCDFPDS